MITIRKYQTRCQESSLRVWVRNTRTMDLTMWPSSIPQRIKRSGARSLTTLTKNKGASFEPLGEMNSILLSMTTVLQNVHCDYKVSLTLSAFELEYWSCTLAFGGSKCSAAETSFVHIHFLVSKMFLLWAVQGLWIKLSLSTALYPAHCLQIQSRMGTQWDIKAIPNESVRPVAL